MCRLKRDWYQSAWGHGNLRLCPWHSSVTDMWTNGPVGVEAASVQSLLEGLHPFCLPHKNICCQGKNDGSNKTSKKKSRLRDSKTPEAHTFSEKIISFVVFLSTGF